MDFSSVRVTHEYCKGFGSPNGLSICTPGAEGAETFALVSEHSGSQVACVAIVGDTAVIADHIGDTMVNPYDVAISASGTFALVADLNSPRPKHIDLATKVVTQPFSGEALSSPRGIAIAPDGTFALVCSQGNDRIAHVDLGGGAPYEVSFPFACERDNVNKPCKTWVGHGGTRWDTVGHGGTWWEGRKGRGGRKRREKRKRRKRRRKGRGGRRGRGEGGTSSLLAETFVCPEDSLSSTSLDTCLCTRGRAAKANPWL